MKILRQIKKLIIKTYIYVLITKWQVDGKSVSEQAQVLFPDGFVGLSSQSKTIMSEFQAENYAQLVIDAKDLINAYGLKDGDAFFGRYMNYGLFRAGSLSMKGDQFTLTYNNVNILANSIRFNTDVELTSIGGKLLINGKEIAVVGGDIDTGTNKITGSGQ